MNRVILTVLIQLTCIVGAACAGAQALAGTYTCANGNPSNAYDYGDIGDFFDDLEEYGISASVTLDVYDDGGHFASNDSYKLGFDGDGLNPIARPVLGLNSSHTLTLRAAVGESPVISGGGANGVDPAVSLNVMGGMFFANIGHITIEGLEFTGGDFGVFLYNLDGRGNIRIARCKIYDLTGPVAVGIVGDPAIPSHPHSVTIENNMFWNCVGPKALGIAGWGVVCSLWTGTNWIVRNNTIVHISTTGTGWDAFNFRGDPVADFSGNIVYIDHVNSRQVFNAVKPLHADRNVVYMGGQAKMSWGTTDWALWQSWGLDANGVNADPQLMSVTPGAEDLRLLPNSPARDLIPSSSLTDDVLGNPRPWGSGYDAGAHEFNNYPAEASLAAGSSLAGPSGGPFETTLAPGSTLSGVTIELTDLESDAISVTGITWGTPGLHGVNAPALPAPGHPVVLAWTGALGPSSAPGTHTWTVEFTDAGSNYPRSCIVSITIPPLSITTHGPLAAGEVGTPYSAAIQFANATGTPAFTLHSGTLPPGLNLAATGEITGTPTQPGAYNFTVQAADNFTTVLQAFDVLIDPHPNPIRITTAVLPEGTRGKTYFASIQTEDASGTVTFTLQSGALPPGLSMGTTGAIFGNPAKTGEYSFTVQAADDYTTAMQAYTLRIAKPAGPGPDTGCVAVAVQPWRTSILALLLAAAALAATHIRGRQPGRGTR